MTYWQPAVTDWQEGVYVLAFDHWVYWQVSFDTGVGESQYDLRACDARSASLLRQFVDLMTPDEVMFFHFVVLQYHHGRVF